jgi:osmotically-inducible protein OsmY
VNIMRRFGLVGFVAGGLLLLASPLSFGQGMGGIGGSGGGGGGFGTSSGGGFAGGGFGTSSGGGFAGSGFGSSSGGGFAGSGFGTSSGGGFAGGFGSSAGGGFAGGGGGMTGLGGFTTTTQVGTSTVFGKYLGNPYAAGIATGRNNTASQYARNFPVTLSFGQPVYTTTGATGTAGRTGLTGITGLAGGAAATANRFAGASSAGIRRAPGYLAEPTFDVPPRSRTELIRPDLQSLIARTQRLPSAANIRVSSDGDTVVLRGRVSSERERLLTEAMIRLTPGVRAVRNELEPPSP